MSVPTTNEEILFKVKLNPRKDGPKTQTSLPSGFPSMTEEATNLTTSRSRAAC